MFCFHLEKKQLLSTFPIGIRIAEVTDLCLRNPNWLHERNSWKISWSRLNDRLKGFSQWLYKTEWCSETLPLFFDKQLLSKSSQKWYLIRYRGFPESYSFCRNIYYPCSNWWRASTSFPVLTPNTYCQRPKKRWTGKRFSRTSRRLGPGILSFPRICLRS